MFTYRTYFNLTNAVNDFEEARQYLIADNMTTYLKSDSRIPENVRSAVDDIVWILKDIASGYIELTANRSLSTQELESISKFVSGQNSDGLGEGFEQQDFACYEDEGLTGYEGDDWDNEMIMASFDWQTNDYLFGEVTDTN